MLCLCAGGPSLNSTFFCSTTSEWCYSYVSTAATYANAVTDCTNRGMTLVGYYSATQQLEVETAFSLSATDYYIGLTFTSGNWRWANGTVLGSGIVPRNADPYAHWGQAANSTYGGNTALTYARATSSAAYSLYSGDGSTAQQTSAYYNTTASDKTHGWIPVAGTASQAYVCQARETDRFSCPPTPPPTSPPPPPVKSFCTHTTWTESVTTGQCWPLCSPVHAAVPCQQQAAAGM